MLAEVRERASEHSRTLVMQNSKKDGIMHTRIQHVSFGYSPSVGSVSRASHICMRRCRCLNTPKTLLKPSLRALF